MNADEPSSSSRKRKVMDDEPEDEPKIPATTPPQKSTTWRHYNVSADQVICRYCAQKFSKKTSTGILQRHLDTRHPDKSMKQTTLSGFVDPG